MDLKELTLVFENCDSITFQRAQIDNFHLGDIVESISMYANAISIDKKVKTCLVGIEWTEETQNQLTDIALRYGYESDNFDEGAVNDFKESHRFKNRIHSNDITSYVLKLDDGTELNIRVPYEADDFHQPNKLQQNKIHTWINADGEECGQSFRIIHKQKD